MTDFSRRQVIGGATGLALTTPIAAAGAAPAASLPGAEPLWPDPSWPDLAPRERLSLDRGWRFHLGHAGDPARDFDFGITRATYAKSGDVETPVALPTFDDSGWAAVAVPHDWAVDLPFTPGGPAGSAQDKSMSYQGFKPLGRAYPATSVGWYRRTFDVPASDLGRRLSIEFDGVCRDCIVILNGFVIGSNESAYAPFACPISDVVNYGGTNILVVRVDTSLGEAWSYEGAGLYRHAWLVKTAPLHVRQSGVVVRSTVDADGAHLTITTEVDNDGPPRTCRVASHVVGPDGKIVALVTSEPVALPAWQSSDIVQTVTLARPQLWSLDTPNLYRVDTEILGDGAVVDRMRTHFGVRTLHFDSTRGFFLNGVPVKIKGTCNHQDHAGVGFALPDRLHVFRLERLKAMGSNAYRATHHPPAAELLDACDRMGMLVLDETRQMSSNTEALGQLERMVRRDRNHPSIFLWSIGNEEIHRGTETGARIAETQKRLINRLDGTRLVTEAMNGKFGLGASRVVDVLGCNYYLDEIDPFHARFPATPMIGTETASTVATRGEYARDDVRRVVPAYDTDFPKWATTAERWWQFYDERPFLAGGFVWTGFDYRGEPTPFEGWPNHSSNFGIMDTCGFAKDNYYYYRSWWQAEPVLHLLPHWNWAGREGEPIAVWCHSNLESVELLVNDRSLGRRAVTKNRHLEWQVPYAPGRIEARGFRGNRRVLTDRRETAGPAAAIKLVADRRRLDADGEDLAVVEVMIVDAAGRPVPTAADRVEFVVDGPLRIIGVGNGDPRRLEPDHASGRSAFNGRCMAIVQSTGAPGNATIVARGTGLSAAILPLIIDQARQIRPFR